MKDYMKIIAKMIGDMCDLHNDYIDAHNKIRQEEGVMKDVAHKLELYRTSDAERQKLATIYANAARERRKCKEFVELFSEFVQYESETRIAECLTQFHINMKEITERQRNRQYTPRSEKIKFDDVEKYKNFNDR